MTNEEKAGIFLRQYTVQIDDTNLQRLATSLLDGWDADCHPAVVSRFIQTFSPPVADVVRYIEPNGFLSAVAGDEQTVRKAICTLALKQLQRQLMNHGLNEASARKAAEQYSNASFVLRC